LPGSVTIDRMKTVSTSALAVTVLLATTAQTAPTGVTAPAPAATAQPIRELQYDFSVVYLQTGETHDETGGIGTAGTGIIQQDSTDGRQGVLLVNVMAAPSDGGLVVSVEEHVPKNPRPVGAQSLCAVYPTGLVICRPNDQPTDVEEELLQHFGREFIDASIVDDKGHWQRTYSSSKYKVVSDFSTKDPLDSAAMHVFEHRTITTLIGVQPDMAEDTRILYDATMSVPDSIHNEAAEAARGAGYVRTTIDLHLTKDSFKKTTP